MRPLTLPGKSRPTMAARCSSVWATPSIGRSRPKAVRQPGEMLTGMPLTAALPETTSTKPPDDKMFVFPPGRRQLRTLQRADIAMAAWCSLAAKWV